MLDTVTPLKNKESIQRGLNSWYNLLLYALKQITHTRKWLEYFSLSWETFATLKKVISPMFDTDNRNNSFTTNIVLLLKDKLHFVYVNGSLLKTPKSSTMFSRGTSSYTLYGSL